MVKQNIRILDEATINKIAAGEVVERPASVVKELVENSLDSGATIIKVDIGSDSGGIFRIRVVDDGLGMDRDSAIISLKRHATSKLSDVSDLLSIQTMGFRGEALASISGVSRFTMITKARSSEIFPGTKIQVEGGNILDISDIGAPEGTSVLVENLFFNTPARKKFLKSRQTEFNHIYSVMENTAIANPSVSFQLVHNGKEKLSTIRADSLLETVSYIYGKDMTDNLLPVRKRTSFMMIDGLCSVQNLNYPNSKQIFISINNRSVSSPVILRAIKRGYGTLLPKDRYPVAFFNITIDKKIVDVNVHPAKREVRLSRENEIANEISSSISETLKSRNLISENVSENKIGSKFSYSSEVSQKSLFKVESEKNHYNRPDMFRNPKDESEGSYHPRFSTTDNQLRLTENFEKKNSDEMKLPPIEVIGQFDLSYIIARIKSPKEDELIIIDQHAAHERVLYDQILKLRSSGKNSQELLVPALLTLKSHEAENLISHISFIADEGFLVEEFGKNTFAVRTVPMILGKRIGTEILRDIITDLMDGSAKTLEEKKEKITTTIACRAAIKAGSLLSFEQMERLVSQLSMTEMPYTCPHGRPTIIVFSRSKLDSLFMRS